MAMRKKAKNAKNLIVSICILFQQKIKNEKLIFVRFLQKFGFKEKWTILFFFQHLPFNQQQYFKKYSFLLDKIDLCKW